MLIPEALRRLKEAGSADDPIWYLGKETTPSLLSQRVSNSRPAHLLFIRYYDRKGKGITGTLAKMMYDRERPQKRHTHLWRHVGFAGRCYQVYWCETCGAVKTGKSYRYVRKS